MFDTAEDAVFHQTSHSTRRCTHTHTQTRAQTCRHWLVNCYLYPVFLSSLYISYYKLSFQGISHGSSTLHYIIEKTVLFSKKYCFHRLGSHSRRQHIINGCTLSNSCLRSLLRCQPSGLRSLPHAGLTGAQDKCRLFIVSFNRSPITARSQCRARTKQILSSREGQELEGTTPD